MAGADEEERTLKQGPPSKGAPLKAAFSSAKEDVPTLEGAPSARPSVGPPLPSGPTVASNTRAHAAETRATLTALHGEEAARARTFGRVTAVLCAGALLAQIPYERDHAMRVAATIAYVALGGMGLFVSYRARDPATYTRAVFRAFAVIAVLAAAVIVQYFGVFSAVSAVVLLGSAFFALGEDRVFGIGAAIAIAVAHGIFAVLITVGAVPDLGIFPGGNAPPVARFATGSLVVFLYFVQIWQARKNRKAVADAIERSHREARLASQRGAQLDEAKDNLNQALRAAQGGGRYTGETCGPYELQEIVGRGAMGEVYAARDKATGALAAVKMLHAATFEEEDSRARFFREAEIAKRLSGPHLVEMKAVGKLAHGMPYIVMELLSGTDLATLLRQRATLSLDETAVLAEHAAHGLAIAHAAGVVHRDLKPSNLFRTEKDGARAIWKVLDFGVSKLGASHGTLTEGRVVGTPGYMSPEQAQGLDCTAAADIFALGAVLYRAITGRRPFGGNDVPQLLFQVVFAQPLRPREVAPGVPRDVENVLAIALAKDPGDRFSSAEELAFAFRAALKNSLPDAHRKKARQLITDLPWGALDTDLKARKIKL